MGWSQSDLARRLACDANFVEQMENGKSSPRASETQLLEMLFQQAELAAYEMVQSCQAEVALKERDLESIDLHSLEFASDSKTADEPKSE